MRHFIGRWLCAMIFLLDMTCGTEDSSHTIRNVVELERLPPEIAKQGIPITLIGVVAYLRAPGLSKFVLLDESGGINSRAIDPAILDNISVGDRVEAVGFSATTRRGNWLVVKSLRLIDKPGLPEPQPITVAEFLEGRTLGGYFEIEGTVRSVRVESEISPSRLILGIGPSRMRLNVWVANYEGHESRWSPDTVVRVRALVQHWRNESWQPYVTFLLAGSPEDIEVLSPAPVDPWSTPQLELADFTVPLAGNVTSRRERVRGMVTWRIPGQQLIIQNGRRGLQIDLNQPDDLVAGDVVEVLGFPSPGDYNGKLEDVEIRRIGHGELPPPITLSEIDITQRLPDGLGHDGLRVRVTGTLDAVYPQPDGLAFDILCLGRRITCMLIGIEALPSSIRPGCELSVVGVSRLGLTDLARRMGHTADSMKLGVASLADLKVLQPAPWWSPERQRMFSVIVAVGLAVIGLWAISLNQKNRRLRAAIAARTRAEHELAGERHRVAADIHDTLEQTLLGVELQVAAASRTLDHQQTSAGGFLTLADQLLKRSRSEIRDIVWDLHRAAQVSAPDLRRALEDLRRDHKAPGAPEITITVDGWPRNLPALVVTHLTRSVREAITNCIKHAAATRIDIRLAYREDEIELSVVDNGCGFEPGLAPGARHGHFGLSGMRERMERIGGSLDLSSKPGEGTRLVFTVSQTNNAL